LYTLKLKKSPKIWY